MKKLLIFALTAVFALSLSSCGKNKKADGTEIVPEKTKTELLCIEKGWVMKSATITPAIEVGGEMTYDWFGKYLYDYEQDDYIVFNTNGSEVIKPGELLADVDEDGYIEEKASTWNFNDNEDKLIFQVPFFYDHTTSPARTFDPDFETANISKLTETEMVLIFEQPLDFTKDMTPYTFTVTYEPKK